MAGKASKILLPWLWAFGLSMAAAAQGGAAASGPKPSETFDKELRSLSQTASKGYWKSIKEKLEDLLSKHESEAYVVARRDEIATLHKNAAFRAKHAPPEPKTLISGKLLVWEPGSSRVKIEYGPKTMGDWIEEGAVHPAAFAGPHSIEIKLAAYPTTDVDKPIPTLLIGAGSDAAFIARYGFAQRKIGSYAISAKASLYRLVGDVETEAAALDGHAVAPGAACTLKLAANETRVTMSVDGRSILSAPRSKKDGFGYVNLHGFPAFEKITLEGKIEPSWLQGLIDAADDEARKSFEADYEPTEAGLPEWLFKAAKKRDVAKDAAGDETFAAWPDALTAEQRARATSAEKMKTKDRLAVFEKAEGAALPEATRRTGLAEALIEAERFDEAIVEFDKAAKLAPESTRIAIGGAEALFLAGRYDDAVAAFAPLVQKAPLSARAAIGQTTALLFSGRTPEAHRAAADAEARGVRSIRLAAIGKRLSKAARGPEWTKRETVRTEHYEIVSDLDRSTCDEAGRVLEESYAAYGRLLGRPKIRGSAKARVYLFSGKAGYERYAQDALGGAPSHTAGLYSPEVKQLLIWNLETRDLMMRTVRHEGFHQYCDRMWRDAPLWLNEGLAEYFETVRIVNGSWSTGEKRKDHLDALASLERLSDYFSRDAAKFYAEPERSYAQAWALVHFMLHGGPEPRKAFDRLKASLDQGHSAARAIEDALPPEVFSTFEAEFRGHVATLRS